jgi:hypothetical protein
MIVFLREKVLESHSLAAKAVINRRWSFFMDMDHFSFSDIAYSVSLSHNAVSPLQVFKTGESFVVVEAIPKRPADGSIGVVAEWVRLVRLRIVGVPVMKYLLFGEFVE